MIFCTKCGNQFQDDSAFCTNCGAVKEAAPALNVEQAPAAPTAPPVSPMAVPAAFCTKCGGKYQSDSVFCTNCGAAKDGSMPNAPYAAAPAVALKKKKFPIIPIAIVTIVAAIATAVVLWVIPLLGLAPLMPAQRALANFSEETAQRIEGSPFQALMLMEEIFQDGAGTFTFDFDYRSGNMWNPDVNGNITLASDTRTFESALSGEIRVMGMPIDITAVMNKERLAVKSNVVDRDNFYGITFATFARDMTQFGNMLGMSQWEINQIIDTVRMIEEAMNVETAIVDNWGDIYTDIMTQFFAGLDFTTQKTDIRVGWESVSVNHIEFVITKNDIVRLLHELVDAFENDPAMRSSFASNPMMMDMGMLSFNELVREMRAVLREIERGFDGSIRLSLYIGKGDRLMQARMDANMRFDGEQATFGVFLDLGSSVNDTWEITVDWSDRWSSDSFTASWDFRQAGQSYENTIRFFDGWDNITLTSTWNPNSGRFDLSYNDGWWTEGFGGSFNTSNDGGFRLQLDRIDLGWDETLDLSMTLSPGADIPRVEFINIDRWDLSLIDLIERSIMGMLW